MRDKYTLFNHPTGEPLSSHPNVEGCKLSSLRHVDNGTEVYWEDTDYGPVQVVHSYGVVNGERRFKIAAI